MPKKVEHSPPLEDRCGRRVAPERVWGFLRSPIYAPSSRLVKIICANRSAAQFLLGEFGRFRTRLYDESYPYIWGMDSMVRDFPTVLLQAWSPESNSIGDLAG